MFDFADMNSAVARLLDSPSASKADYRDISAVATMIGRMLAPALGRDKIRARDVSVALIALSHADAASPLATLGAVEQIARRYSGPIARAIRADYSLGGLSRSLDV